MNRITSIVLSVLSLSALAQNSGTCIQKNWEYTYGGDGNDVVREVLQLNDSTYILAGETGSSMSGEVSQPDRGLGDAWVVCIDTAGTIRWDQRYGGNAPESFASVARTNDGGLIFAGLTRSGMSGEVSEPSYSPNLDDIWVVRTTADGTILWDKRYGGSEVDYAHKILAVPDGSFYIAATTGSTASGNKTSSLVGGRDLWFLHIDAAGTLLWDVTYGGSGNEYLEGAVVNSAGAITAVSTTYSQASGNISLPQRGSPDMWALQIDNTGALAWERRYGGTGQEFAADIMANNGGFMIGGSSNSPVSFEVNTPNNGFVDGWVLNINSAGVPLGGRHQGGAGFDGITAMAPLSPGVVNGDVILGGYSSSPISGTVMSDPLGQRDYWLNLCGHQGIVISDTRCGTAINDELKDMIVTTDNGYLMAGYSTSDTDQDKHQDSRGIGDFWVVKLGYVTDTTWYRDQDGDGYGNSDEPFTGCERPPGYIPIGAEDCNDTDPNAYNGAPCDDGDPLTENDTYTNSCACIGEPLNPMPVRMALQGPWNPGGMIFMDDHLRVAGLLPLTEPYSALGFVVTENSGAQMEPALMNNTGQDAPVDFVLIEFRNANDPSLIVASRVGMLMRDMDVVALDGTPFRMRAPVGAYYIAVRHRNHLGVMTDQPVSFDNATAMVNFSNHFMGNYGTGAQRYAGFNMLWAGDVSSDGQLRYTGPDNDRDPILVEVGGSIPTNTVTGYHTDDVNLDSEVKYTGPDNDRDIILQNIGGSVPTNIRYEQLP